MRPERQAVMKWGRIQTLHAMPLQRHAHPFSSDCQKVLMALYANAMPFDYITRGDAAAAAALRALWPLTAFRCWWTTAAPLPKPASSSSTCSRATRAPCDCLPDDAPQALDVRCMDRFFDLDVHTPIQKIVPDRRTAGPPDRRTAA